MSAVRTRLTAAVCAAMLAFCTVTPAHAQESAEVTGYQPTAVAPGLTAVVAPPLPRGQADYEASGLPEWALLNDADGSIRLAPGEEVTPGTYEWPVQANMYDGTSQMFSVRVVVGEEGAPITGQGAIIDAFVQYAPDVSQRCSATALGVGLPLMILLPLGFASQMSLPFVAKQNELSLLVADTIGIDVKLRDLNSRSFDMGVAGALTVAGLAGAGAIISQCAK